MEKELIRTLESAIDILEEGHHYIKVDRYFIEKGGKGRIRVDSYLFYNTINDIPIYILKPELQRVKEHFIEMVNETILFKEYVFHKGVDYYLILDYQNGGVCVCCEENGEYKEYIHSRQNS